MRELENVIERAMILARGDQLSLRELPGDRRAARRRRAGLGRHGAATSRCAAPGAASSRDDPPRARGDRRQSHARGAKLLGISHRALLYKIKEYGLGGDAEAE